MKVLQIGTVIAILFAALGFVLTPQMEDFFAQSKLDGSLRAALSSPDAMEGKSITVEGYEQYKFEGNALLLSKHASQTGEMLYLAIDEKNRNWRKFKEFANRLVKMTGTFSHPKTGNTNYRPCWLSDITDIDLVDSK